MAARRTRAKSGKNTSSRNRRPGVGTRKKPVGSSRAPKEATIAKRGTRKPAPRKKPGKNAAVKKPAPKRRTAKKSQTKKTAPKGSREKTPVKARETAQKRAAKGQTAARKTTTKSPTAKRTARKGAIANSPTPERRAKKSAAKRTPTLRPAPRRPASTRLAAAARADRTRIAAAKQRDVRQVGSRPVAKAKPAPPASKSAARGRSETDAALLDTLDDLIGRALRAGADAADAVTIESASLSRAVRLGEPETLERSESRDLGLRVLVGRRQAIVSSSDFKPDTMTELVERAIAMARAVPDDKYCGLAGPDQIAIRIPDLDQFDPIEPTPDLLLERARTCEDAARAVRGITNSIGAEASWGRSRIALVASNGFAGGFASSHHSISVSVVAGSGTAMERDHDMSVALFANELEKPETVGRRAAERTLRRLKPRKIASSSMPVVFEPRVANGLVAHVASAANGSAIARGTSFLKDAMGSRILPNGLSVIDEPDRMRGLNSMPFDGEGIAARRLAIVDDGTLASWVLDLATARQLGLDTTGHARRGTSGAPSPGTSNLYLEGGSGSVDELIADIDRGLLVTDLMGFGVNLVTGDYSRGAAGFLIEKGKVTDPVSEVTIAGNLKEMMATMRAAGDLEFRYGTNAPTIRIERMMVAGS
jgi:PmbA protein